MKHLVGKKISEQVPFMGETVEVRKLSVSEIFEVRATIQKVSKSKKEDAEHDPLRYLVRLTVTGAEELSDEDFNQFPLDELNKLSEEILRVSGLGGTPAGN